MAELATQIIPKLWWSFTAQMQNLSELQNALSKVEGELAEAAELRKEKVEELQALKVEARALADIVLSSEMRAWAMSSLEGMAVGPD